MTAMRDALTGARDARARQERIDAARAVVAEVERRLRVAQDRVRAAVQADREARS